jgi:hypothetical protein
MCLAGIRPLDPGFKRVEIRPQLADLESLELTAHTAQGPIRFQAHGQAADRELTVELPPACAGELVVRAGASLPLATVPGEPGEAWERYQLPAGQRTSVRLRRT